MGVRMNRAKSAALSDTAAGSREDRRRIATETIAGGGLVLVLDRADRENEGDLVCAAEHATAEHIAFMAVYGRGLICAPITEQAAARLRLDPMVRESTDRYGTAFTVSVDAASGITTGISAADRARTIAVLADPRSQSGELRKPGHVFPLVARVGGVLERPGHTEAAVDLARLAGCTPAGVICEVLRDDGETAGKEELSALASRHRIPIITVEEIIAWRRTHDASIHVGVDADARETEGDLL